jgi:dephospho-CoA kinase
VIVVGLTGGIGSGKSEVARRLAIRGAVSVDADALAHEALAPGTPGLAAVVREFGDGVLAPDGSLDRERLGQVVFNDPDRRAALEAIVHPYVERRRLEIVALAPADSVVVYDVPLLVEKQMADAFDVVVVVEAPEDVRIGRLVTERAMAPDDARARVRTQASDDERRAVADVVLRNDSDLSSLRDQADALWARLAGAAAAKAPPGGHTGHGVQWTG